MLVKKSAKFISNENYVLNAKVLLKQCMYVNDTVLVSYADEPVKFLLFTYLLQGQYIYERGSKHGKRVQSNMVCARVHHSQWPQ